MIINKRSKSNLEKLINNIILNYIPKSFLEDYTKIVEFSKKLNWSKKPKIIFTAVKNLSDDVFKIWASEKKKNFNSKLIYCCHGAGFQTHLFSTQNFFLKRTCDKILVWGKNRVKSKKIKTFLNIKSSSRPFTQKQTINYNDLKILIPQDMPTIYTYHLLSSILHFSEHKTYIDEQKQFLKRLNHNVKQKVVIRLGSSVTEASYHYTEDYEKKVWNNGTHKYLLESRNIPIIESINKSYIVIITQLSSTMLLECISSNIPFVIFADLKKQVVTSNFRKILVNLKSSQIFFDQPKKIANFLNQTNALEVKKWWKSRKIQKKIKFLQDNFAIYKSNPIVHLAKELKN
jgi:putative transferase (TIGR04331 family)